MPLNETFPRAIVFIVADREQEDGRLAKEPIGTGFILSMRDESVSQLHFRYVVTAAHCVRAEQQTWVRVPISETEVRDALVRDWVYHPNYDIAVTSFVEAAGPWRTIPLRPSSEEWDRLPNLGDRIYFLGLLSGVPEMGNLNIPIVRSGTIGALYQERVPVKQAPDLTVEYTAHLIDCRSYQGFSGSPCFVQWEEWRPGSVIDQEGQKVEALGYGSTTLLFGMVIAHIEVPNQDGDKANSGVAVAVPVEHIKETLQMAELAEEREESQRR